MNPFHHALLTSITPGDIENLTLRVSGGQETILTTISWFNAFETALFPQVVNDKDNFFLYGTDHADAAGGRLMWGKGNNLDLSDFVEVAPIVLGNQAETPWPLNVPSHVCGDNETFHLFYHTHGIEPGNAGFQQTRLLTSSGGAELHNMVFTDRGRPLGIVGDENHTGYCMPYELSMGQYIATHIAKGGLPQPWKNSTASNPRTWTRGETIDVINGVEDGFFAQLSEGRYFNYYGITWWLGQIHPESGGTIENTRKLILAKADKIGGSVTQVAILNHGDTNIRHSVKIRGNTAHIYITNPASKMYHGTYDLRNLQKYI